jgi:hypothetical protein
MTLYPVINKTHRIERSQFFWGIILLVIPFTAGYLYTGALMHGLDTAFSYDEFEHHYPVILQFCKELPFPNIKNYNSATAPLFHILFAIAGKITGTDIQHLRMINFLITILAVILLFKLLIDHFSLPYPVALLSCLLFELSPYFFREAFVVMTDNLPVLWLVLFMNYYLKFKKDRMMQNYALSMFFVMLLCLTRQTYLYILLPVTIDIIGAKDLKHSRILLFLILFLSILPTLLLFVVWKGLTPPQFQERHTDSSLLNLKPILYGFSVLGFYALFIAGKEIYRSFLNLKKIKIVCGILLGWALLVFFPLIKIKHDFGYLWHVAERLPSIHNSSIFFYVLLSIGVCIFLAIAHLENPPFFLILLLALFLSEVPNKYFFQRYFDNSILIFLLLLNATYYRADRFQFLRMSLLTLLFAAYFMVFTVAS